MGHRIDMKAKRKKKQPPKPLKPLAADIAKFMLCKGTNVKIRRHGETQWSPHTMQRTVEMRTTKRVRDTLYLEYLGYEVKYRSPSLVTSQRFNRY